MYPTPTISATTKRLRTASERVLPARTAERAMGSDLKRSTTPFCKSWASPTPVWTAPKITVWAKKPDNR